MTGMQRRATLACAALLAAWTLPAAGQEWQKKFPVVKYGVIPVETQTSTTKSMTDFLKHAEKETGTKWELYQATDYSGVMNASGAVIRVVERLPSAEGIPSVAACGLDSTDSRHSATLTISIASAPSGQALTHAGDWPSERRPWHMSHLPTTPRSGLYCGTPYEQFQVQY